MALWKILFLVSVIILSAFSFRWGSTEIKKTEALEWVAHVKALPRDRMESEPLNYLRGDYRVSLQTPPFHEISWTVNLLTRQIISWQSQKKEDSVLRSLL